MKILKQSVGIDISMEDFHVVNGVLLEDFDCQFSNEAIYSNCPRGIRSFIQQIKRQQKDPSTQFVLEVTGVYHEKVAYALHKEGFLVCIVLSTKAKAFMKSLNQRTKTDKIDAMYLCQLGLERNLDKWQPALPIFSQLKAFTRERSTLVAERSVLKNKLHALGASRRKTTSTTRRIEQRIKLINKHIKIVESEIQATIKSEESLSNKVDNILQVKGLSITTIATILAETNGFEWIRNQKQLVGYCGLDVTIHQSGKYKSKGRLSKKGNSHIRKALYMPALNASRSNTSLKILYQQLSDRQSAKKQAIIVVAKKLLLLIYALWKNETQYDPEKNIANRLTLYTV